MRIIAHRGASGLELENSLAAIRRAAQLGASAIEFDIRLTKDRQVVVCHDADLKRVSNSNAKIADLTFKEIRKIKLKNGEQVPTLTEALDAVGLSEAVIEPKEDGMADELCAELAKHPDVRFSILTFKRKLALDLRHKLPDAKIYVATFWRPQSAFHFAKTFGMNGVAVHFSALNFYIDWRCRSSGMELYVYTVNSRWHARLIGFFFPTVSIATNHIEKL